MAEEWSRYKLATIVDAEVAKLRKRWGKRLPGFTLAINRGGRAVLAEGYGVANAKTGAKMLADTRSPMGSLTKATVTGPAGWQMIHEQAPPIPPDRKLYGPDGLFGGAYDKDAMIGVRRHTPIVDVAIGPDNRVHAWYVDGTMSIGTSTDLARHRPRTKFVAADDKTVLDICGIGISKSGRVWTWYADGTCSIGTPTDLGARGFKTRPDEQDPDKEVPVVCTPAEAVGGGEQPMTAIVGIDIAKSDDHVYVWYEDGTTSSGTSTDLGYYSGCRTFSGAKVPGGAPYEIRGVGIAADDHVYAWFANGRVTSGSSTDLDRYRGPAPYALPAFEGTVPDWWSWIRSITLQHLLDHRAGFMGGGDVAGAARMFNLDDAEVAYEHVHRHFLRTRKLLFEPDTDTKYSNHGMGLWTLVIERETGMRFRDYVHDRYLAPNGFDKGIAPRTDPPTGLDSAEHRVSDGVAVPTTLDSHETGLASGGYRASAKGVALVMRKLTEKYGKDVDRMGWFNVDGRLQHNGKTGGGFSFAAMYPPGHVEDGVDYGGVHIAYVANVSDTSMPDPDDPEASVSLHQEMTNMALRLAGQVNGATEPTGCGSLHERIAQLTQRLGDLHDRLSDSDRRDPDGSGPVTKPARARPSRAMIEAEIAETEQQLAKVRSQAKTRGCLQH